MDITSSTSNSTASASAPHNNQQEAMVSSPTKKEQARNKKKARATQQASVSGEPKPRPQQDAAFKCPRCDSTSTKFSYYNNYNAEQPRYYCKACRRYWTQGGTLRNVPVGGGSRKQKRASGSGSGLVLGSSSHLMNSMNEQLRKILPTRPVPTMTGLIPDVSPTFMPGDGSGFNLTMDDQQIFLPLAPLSLPNKAPTLPSFLDILQEGFLDGDKSSSYGGALATSGGNNGMDMPFPVPSFGAMHGHDEMRGFTTEAMDTQLLGAQAQQGVNDVADGLQWASSQHGNYINDDGCAGSTGMQQVVSDQQQQDKEAIESTNNDDNGGSSVYSFWINTSNNNGAGW